MGTYSVVADDGKLYGPVNETGIAEWIRQGRVSRQTILHCHDTNARTQAWAVPELQPTLGLSPQEVDQLLHGKSSSAVPPGSAALPAPMPINYHGPIDYRAQQIYGEPMGPTLSTFPTFAAVLLCIFVPFFAIIYYGIVHGNLPRRRHDDPGAGKAIGFMFIPFFNLYWICFFWTRLCTRINDERMRVGLPPTAPRGLVIAILWCYLGMFIPFLNILVGLAILVMLIIAEFHLQGSINELALATGSR